MICILLVNGKFLYVENSLLIFSFISRYRTHAWSLLNPMANSMKLIPLSQLCMGWSKNFSKCSVKGRQGLQWIFPNNTCYIVHSGSRYMQAVPDRRLKCNGSNPFYVEPSAYIGKPFFWSTNIPRYYVYIKITCTIPIFFWAHFKSWDIHMTNMSCCI